MKISEVAETTTTILRDVTDSQHARWSEFHARYEPMMRAFMQKHFPSLDADDVIQETFLALMKILPRYVYNPKENGYFHNYLTGILRNKARKALTARLREASLRKKVQTEAIVSSFNRQSTSTAEMDYKSWRDSVFEIALQQYLADETVNSRTKQVFTRLAVNGERPDDVARAFGIERNAVDQIKNRAMTRLKKIVKGLEQLEDARFDR